MTNTLNDQLLENVQVEMEEPDGFSVLSRVSIPSLGYDKPATTYTLVELTDPNIGQCGGGVAVSWWGRGMGEG